jgi:hypothetical protein
MGLLQKQQLFSKLLVQLIEHAYKSGYSITMGEAWRPQSTASYYASVGKGIKNSLHTQRLAIDLNLFKGDKYLTKSNDYKPLGEFWESLSGENYQCCWGGRFGDGNHFSIEHGGRK